MTAPVSIYGRSFCICSLRVQAAGYRYSILSDRSLLDIAACLTPDCLTAACLTASCLGKQHA
jgi:hypothetical protein